MITLFTMIQLALLIMLPIVLFYKNSSWEPKKYIPAIIIVYITWYLTYAFLHEICHLLSAYAQGLKVYKYQLIPHFWKGEFGKGFVESDVNKHTVIMPYIKDVVFSVIGVVIANKIKINNLVLSGVVFTILIFSPLFDITNNYFVYLMYSINDFRALSTFTGKNQTNIIGFSFLLITLVNTIYTLTKTQHYPFKEK